ncbi:TPR repeat-containing serine/threonine protein kinase [Anabaenopsis circularis NIES-21]|uniref:TPR repeat-containing serine/threonine protein kinase n=1 Tax=Anabaenopsis circularis NIES-21 TaxID=1085406 RepID=A0A1Z4GMY9_9CYAN|nr:TPR repeat-containing serine/threonine protein kinase [Anabaenopsis circularis NIES-21]
MDDQILVTRYRIIELLYTEESVKTYLVEDITIPEQQFIIKQLRPETNNPQNLAWLRQSFFKEAKVLQQLGRENDRIQKIVACFEADEEFYLVQELIDGHELAEEILVGFPLREDQVINLLLEILDILLFIHYRNVIHQDIQPASVIRRYSDNRLVLVDFGSVQEMVTTIVGNLEYIPLEQLQGQPQYNSDIYALGIIAIAAIMGLSQNEISRLQSQKNLLTGEIIWRDRTIKVSRELTKIINKMVRFDYHKRYQSVTEVINDLQQLKNYQYQPQKLQFPRFRLIFIGITSLLVALIIGCFSQWLKPINNEQILYQEGISEYDQGNYQESVNNFTQPIKINPQNSVAYNHQDNTFYRLGNYEKVQANSSRAIALNPQNANAYYDRGFAWFGLGKYKEAIADYTKAIKLNSQNPYAYYGRGLARVKVQDYQAAMRDFNQAIALNSNYGLAYYHRGLVSIELGKKKAALRDFKTAEKLFQQQGDKSGYHKIVQEIKALQK